jgi:hypothetical protein
MQALFDDLIKSLGALRPMVASFAGIDGRMTAASAALAVVNQQLEKAREQIAGLRDLQGRERHEHKVAIEALELRIRDERELIGDETAFQRAQLVKLQNQISAGHKEVEELALGLRRERRRLGI